MVGPFGATPGCSRSRKWWVRPGPLAGLRGCDSAAALVWCGACRPDVSLALCSWLWAEGPSAGSPPAIEVCAEQAAGNLRCCPVAVKLLHPVPALSGCVHRRRCSSEGLALLTLQAVWAWTVSSVFPSLHSRLTYFRLPPWSLWVLLKFFSVLKFLCIYTMKYDHIHRVPPSSNSYILPTRLSSKFIVVVVTVI